MSYFLQPGPRIWSYYIDNWVVFLVDGVYYLAMGHQPPMGVGHVGGLCADPSWLLPWLVLVEVVENQDLAAED